MNYEKIAFVSCPQCERPQGTELSDYPEENLLATTFEYSFDEAKNVATTLASKFGCNFHLSRSDSTGKWSVIILSDCLQSILNQISSKISYLESQYLNESIDYDHYRPIDSNFESTISLLFDLASKHPEDRMQIIQDDKGWQILRTVSEIEEIERSKLMYKSAAKEVVEQYELELKRIDNNSSYSESKKKEARNVAFHDQIMKLSNLKRDFPRLIWDSFEPEAASTRLPDDNADPDDSPF